MNTVKFIAARGIWAVKNDNGSIIYQSKDENDAKVYAGISLDKPEQLILEVNSKFSSADSNNDGVLTDEELESYLEQ